MENAVASAELTKEQRQRVREILAHTPVVALPNGGMGRYPDTVDGVIGALDHLSQAVKFWINRHEGVDDELGALKRDLKAAGRIVKLITADGE